MRWATDPTPSALLTPEVVYRERASGASPHTFTLDDVRDGDFAALLMVTRNSVPAAAPTAGGATWTEQWHHETGSDEEVNLFTKRCLNEPSSWEMTHTVGSTVLTGVVVWRNLLGAVVDSDSTNDSRVAPAVDGIPNAIHVIVGACCFSATAFGFGDDYSFEYGLTTDNGDQGLDIRWRLLTATGATATHTTSGGDNTFCATGALIVS